MRRIFTVVTTLALAGAPVTAMAQSGAPSLAERLALFTKGGGEDQQQPAVKQTAAQSSRSPRERWTQPKSKTRSSSGGGFSLRKLFSRGSSADEGETADNRQHPMPYDPADLQQHSQGNAPGRSDESAQRSPQRNSSAVVTDRTGNARRNVPLGPQRESRSQAATSPRQRSATPAARTPVASRGGSARTAPTPRPVRRSPTVSASRGHDELDEALVDLQAARAGAQERSADSRADEVPDYLQEIDAAVEAPRPRVARGPGDASAPRPSRSSTAPGAVVDFGRALTQRGNSSRRRVTATPQQETPPRQAAAPMEIPDPAGGKPQSILTTRPAAPAHTAGVRPPRAEPEVQFTPPTSSGRYARGGEGQDVGALLDESLADAVAPLPAEEIVPTPPTPPVAKPVEVKPQVAAQPAAQPEAPIATVAVAAQPKPRKPGPHVLFTSRQPVIVSRVEGPRQLTVGRPAAYRIVLENLGDVPASEVLAVVTVPDTAALIEATATAGAIEQLDSDPGVQQVLNWEMHELAAGETKTMDLRLSPRTGANLALGVRFSHAPVGSDAVVTVQEPLLAMNLQGPDVVQYGVAQRYKLVLTNPGTGAAEDVKLELLPPGGDETAKIHHRVGTLSPGETKELELELTAREAGALEMAASATATGGVVAQAVKAVKCVRPELQLDWRGPGEKYSGAVATYYLRVRNPGEAATDAVAVAVNLPTGATLVSASDGHAPGADDGSFAWHGAPLQPGEERYLQFKCRLTAPGDNHIGVRAETPSGLTDNVTAATSIIAVADLKLDIADPKGPVPVGEAVVYEIRVRNRGSIAARGVSIVGLFSAGIDPLAVEGGKHTVRDGRVAFRTIDSLSAGGEVVMKIQAQAHGEGTHVFRAEVMCQDLEMKLSAEEMTRFFVEENPWDSAATAYGDEPPTRR